MWKGANLTVDQHGNHGTTVGMQGGGTNIVNNNYNGADDGQRKCDVLIMVAKDKEFADLNENLLHFLGHPDKRQLVAEAAQNVNVELAKDKSCLVCTFKVDNNVSCVCCCVEKAGKLGMKCYERDLLMFYKPHFLTTFGFAAGEYLHKAVIITEFIEDKTDKEAVKFTNGETQVYMDFWRNNQNDILRPDTYSRALVVDHVINDKSDVKARLDESRSSCLEMEIATIYNVLECHNYYNPKLPTIAFPAFKGISDEGNQAQRDSQADGGMALRTAAWAMLNFIALHAK